MRPHPLINSGDSDTDSSEGEEDGEALLRTTASLLTGSVARLPGGVVDIKKLRDANISKRADVSTCHSNNRVIPHLPHLPSLTSLPHLPHLPPSPPSLTSPPSPPSLTSLPHLPPSPPSLTSPPSPPSLTSPPSSLTSLPHLTSLTSLICLTTLTSLSSLICLTTLSLPYIQAVIQSVEFHPSANVMLTAGMHKTLSLFQVYTHVHMICNAPNYSRIYVTGSENICQIC